MMEHSILNDHDIVQVSFDGQHLYVIYKVVAPRSINAKANRKANEVLIVGIPPANQNKWCLQHGIIITDKNGNIVLGKE